MPINYRYCLWNNGEAKKVARLLFQKEMKIRGHEVAYKSSLEKNSMPFLSLETCKKPVPLSREQLSC
jgi:hypothetical protein